MSVYSGGKQVAAGYEHGHDLGAMPIWTGTSSDLPSERDAGTIYLVKDIIQHTPAEWAANPADLKVAADDIAANGESSAYYAQFAQFMADDADFTVAIENASTYTNVAADQVIQYRLVDINRADAAGTVHGLYFQAKKSLPKAYKMDASTETITGGWPSMTLRTEMNSGEIWSMHPSALRDVMATVANISCGPGGTHVTSQDKLFVASLVELSPGSTNFDDGPQFAYWASKGATSSNYAPLANMDTTNSGAALPDGWWTRSMFLSGTFAYKGSGGGLGSTSQTSTHSVVPCFAV